MDIPSFGNAMSKVQPGTFVPDLPTTGAPKITPLPEDAAAVSQPATASFADTLKGMLNDVNDKVVTSDQNAKDLAMGKTNDLNKVVTSVEEANLSMQFTMAIRNKLMESYQEISRMTV